MALFEPGKQFPDDDSLERLSKYKRFRKFFDGKQGEIVKRVSELLKHTPHSHMLKSLYTSVNIIDPLTTKPADMMFGEPPSYRAGNGEPDSPEQKAIHRLTEDNALNAVGWEAVVGAGIRGDAWLKVRYGYRHDFSELEDVPDDVYPEIIIESVPGKYVFPEVSRGNRKRFKAVNIAWVDWVESIDGEETPYLILERHIPGWIQHKKFKLESNGVYTLYDVPIDLFHIIEEVESREEDTGLSWIPVHHIPYKSTDDCWMGIGNIEKVEPLLIAIDERLTQIDYILWKHADPTAYVPAEAEAKISKGGPGQVIGLQPGDVEPGFMTWDSQLEAAFKELDRLIGKVFAICETPQWVFGSTITEMDAGGTGTSHTDGTAIQARFLPLISKVRRIRVHVDRAIRNALWTAMHLEKYIIENGEGALNHIEKYTPVYPKINWKDGLPKNKKEVAETMAVRSGNKPTIDQFNAIVEEEQDTERALQIYEALKREKEEAMKEFQAQQPSVNLDDWNDDDSNINGEEEKEAEE